MAALCTPLSESLRTGLNTLLAIMLKCQISSTGAGSAISAIIATALNKKSSYQQKHIQY